MVLGLISTNDFAIPDQKRFHQTNSSHFVLKYFEDYSKTRILPVMK